MIVADFGSATGTILKNAAAPRMTSIMQATVFAITDSFFMLSASLNSTAPGLCSACGRLSGSRLNLPM